MGRLLQPVLVILWKDILLELRSRDVVVSVAVFGLVVAVVFQFALNVTPRLVNQLAPGILWVAFALAGVLVMNRTFVREKEQGGLEGLLLTPVSRDAIFLGKALATLVLMLTVEGVLLPVFAVMLGFSGFSWELLVTIGLVTLGFVTVGTLFSAIAVQTRSREILLPVLFFPIILPALIGGVEVSGSAMAGRGLGEMGLWLPLIGVFDAVFLVICPWVFTYVVEE